MLRPQGKASCYAEPATRAGLGALIIKEGP